MTWSKEYEVILPSTASGLDRQQAYADLFQYHHETFLPAHGVTTAVDTYRTVASSVYDGHAYRCKRTITPNGRPNIPTYEKAWAQLFEWRTDSVSTVIDVSFKWDGTDNPMPSTGAYFNDYFQTVYYRASLAPRAIPTSGDLRYKYYVSSEDSNTWMLFCNGFLIGHEFGDDAWWREVDPNFYTTSIIAHYDPGFYFPALGRANNPWYYSGSSRQDLVYGLPMLTNSYDPIASPTNFLITDNMYLYLVKGYNGSNITTLSTPYLIGKNQRTDMLLKCRNTTAMYTTLSASAAESILYNGKYYIDLRPTSSTSILLETTADEGII